MTYSVWGDETLSGYHTVLKRASVLLIPEKGWQD